MKQQTEKENPLINFVTGTLLHKAKKYQIKMPSDFIIERKGINGPYIIEPFFIFVPATEKAIFENILLNKESFSIEEVMQVLSKEKLLVLKDCYMSSIDETESNLKIAVQALRYELNDAANVKQKGMSK
jgi:hypothetical protein